MANPEPKDIAASTRAKLRNLASADGHDFEFVLGRYAIEGLLRRLAASKHRDRFVLKGALLFVLWGIDRHRVTRDVDFLGFGSLNPGDLALVFREILSTPIQPDGLTFRIDTTRASPIRQENEYGGTRVVVVAELARAEVSVQIDVGIGDAVEHATAQEFPTLLGGVAPVLRAYPKEYSIAEKFHAMVELGGQNTRMKDYYDIFVLSRTFDFGLQPLARAINATFSRRRRALPVDLPFGLSTEMGGDALKNQQWSAFLRKSRVPLPHPCFAEIVANTASFLMPPCSEAAEPTGLHSRWQPSVAAWVNSK